MADEFLAFLVIGLVVLGVGLIIVSAPFIPAGEKPLETTVFQSGFGVNYASESRGIDLGSKQLFSGLLFGSNELRQHIEVEGVENLSLSFSVRSTNNLAPLVITVNGKNAAIGNYAIGDYRIDIPQELMSDEMDIEVKPVSSLWRIWAPNTYSLRKVKVDVRSLSFGKKELKFLVGSELDNFDEARIEFVLDKNVGAMSVLLNQNQVFSGFLKNEHSVKLKKEDLMRGENKLELVPQRNSRLSGVARVVLFSQEKAAPPAPAAQASFRPLSMFEQQDP